MRRITDRLDCFLLYSHTRSPNCVAENSQKGGFFGTVSESPWHRGSTFSTLLDTGVLHPGACIPQTNKPESKHVLYQFVRNSPHCLPVGPSFISRPLRSISPVTRRVLSWQSYIYILCMDADVSSHVPKLRDFKTLEIGNQSDYYTTAAPQQL